MAIRASITALPDFRRTMREATLRLGRVLNQTDLARDVAVPQPTVQRWLNPLEASNLAVRPPPNASNRTEGLIKTPKVHWGDVGLALHLAGTDAPTGDARGVPHAAWREANGWRLEEGMPHVHRGQSLRLKAFDAWLAGGAPAAPDGGREHGGDPLGGPRGRPPRVGSEG